MSDKELLNLIYKKHVAVGFIIELVEGDWGGSKSITTISAFPNTSLVKMNSTR